MILPGEIGRLVVAESPGLPRLSVVISHCDKIARSDRLFADLVARSSDRALELVLVTAGPSARLPQLLRRYPMLRVVHAPPRARVQEQRRLGMTAASGDIVAFVDASDLEAAEEQIQHLLNMRPSLS